MAGQPDPAALRDLPFFAGLDAAAVAEVVRAGQARRLPEGATLFEQGAEARGVYLLLQGRLKAVQTGADGQQVIVRFLGPGEPAGVLGMLGPGQRYPASVAGVDSSAASLACRSASSRSSRTWWWLVPAMFRVPPAPAPQRSSATCMAASTAGCWPMPR